MGLMVIKYDSEYRKYRLIINDETYGLYDSAVAAADDVYTCTTGCNEWDSLDPVIDAPTDIHEWEKVNS